MRSLVCSLAAALTLLLAGCGSKVTEENYANIHEGMTEEQVIDLLGKPSRSSSIDVLGVSGTSATWSAGGASITIQFVNDKVRLKSFSKPAEGG